MADKKVEPYPQYCHNCRQFKFGDFYPMGKGRDRWDCCSDCFEKGPKDVRR